MSVYQRNGHWHLTITINGKRIRRAIREAQTRRQAEKAERILRNEIYENRFGIGGQKLFSDFVENSYKPYAKEHKKGYDVELSVLKALIDRFGKDRLCEITAEEIERFKRHRSSEITTRGNLRSKATVNRDIAVLSAVFGLAKEFGEIKENPVSHVRYYGNLPSRERILSDSEEIILFKHLTKFPRLSQLVELLLYTGLRRGELFKLERRDVDLIDGFIELRKETTKAGRSRIIPMLSNVWAILEARSKELVDKNDNAILFPGTKTRAASFSSMFRKICKDDLSWPDVTVHTLRHTFSTRADRLNVGAFAQKDILGHSKLTMTSKYTHPSKETLRSHLVSFEEFVLNRNISLNKL